MGYSTNMQAGRTSLTPAFIMKYPIKRTGSVLSKNMFLDGTFVGFLPYCAKKPLRPGTFLHVRYMPHVFSS